jgi:hypothetical protein
LTLKRRLAYVFTLPQQDNPHYLDLSVMINTIPKKSCIIFTTRYQHPLGIVFKNQNTGGVKRTSPKSPPAKMAGVYG